MNPTPPATSHLCANVMENRAKESLSIGTGQKRIAAQNTSKRRLMRDNLSVTPAAKGSKLASVFLVIAQWCLVRVSVMIRSFQQFMTFRKR